MIRHRALGAGVNRPADSDVWIVLATLALAALALLPWIGSLPYYFEEPRRVLIARTMLESGSWFVPRLDGLVYLAKPPLYNWLLMPWFDDALVLAPGAARAVSVAAGALLAASVVYLTRRWFSVAVRCALGAALVLSPELAAKASLAEIDIVFSLFVTLGIWFWFARLSDGCTNTRLWLVPLVLISAAFMTKGPQAPVFFYASVVPWLFLSGRIRLLFSAAHIVAFLIALLLPALWIANLITVAGLDAISSSFAAEVTSRGTGLSLAEHFKHALVYPLELVGAALLLGFAVLLLVRKSVRQDVLSAQYPVARFALLALLINLIPYLTRDAAVRYFLPMLPTLLILAASVAEHSSQRSVRRALSWISGAGFAIAVGLVVALGVLHILVSIGRDVLPTRLSLGAAGVLVASCLALIILLWRKTQGVDRLGWRLAAAVLVFGLAVRCVVLDVAMYKKQLHLNSENSARQVGEFLDEHAAGTKVVYLGKLPYSVVLLRSSAQLTAVAGHGYKSDDKLLLYVRPGVPGPLPPKGSREIARMPYTYEGITGKMLLLRAPR